MNKWKEYYEKLLTENRQEYSTISPTEINISGEVINIPQTKKAVAALKNNRAPGPQNIPGELVKCGTEKLFKALTWCINRFLNGAPIPKEWKIAYISSIHKKGNKQVCSNYRGISVTSTLSRLYGRILRDLIEQEYQQQEEEEQSGFRTGRTCTDNIFCLKQLIEKKVVFIRRHTSCLLTFTKHMIPFQLTDYSRTAKDDKDIKKRISQARRTIGCLNGVFWSNEAGKKRKINIYQTLVKSSLLYGAETWRITEANRKKLEAVEMDAYRRTLGISRRDRVRNEEIQQRIGIEGSLATDIERQQLMWYGHVG
ncbi:uncharacterized protein LOC115884770 [Sitophilus oryzae]|uniref:Uncharacterized protein LOC115884770 n=1 Tax=Sitophilus oryzae TaxID=7048 RepID=A0A6J2Y7X4_SITOR|nr:uncharacterized protein LOC115884770 [Sitophilus oryzae]